MSAELSLGYKQTEVGAIPVDWDVDSVVNVAAITTGDKNTQDRVDDGIYPFFVRSSTIESINSYTFDGEAVLTAGDGVGTGKIFHYVKEKFDFHQRVYKISDFCERLDGFFFYLYFSSHFYSRIIQMTAKSSVDSVRREMIADMRIPLPPPAEQRAIAAALSDVDALLAKLDALIAKKRDIKQAAMQQLLTGQTRLPGFGGTAGYRQTDVGLIPEDWEVRTFRDICMKIQDGTHFSPTPGGNDYLYITSKNIGFGTLDVTSADRISATEHQNIYSRCDVKRGDLLLTKDGANTGNAAINTLDEPFSLLSSVAFLRFDCRLHSAQFFLYQILSQSGQRRLKLEMSGNAITRLTLTKINALRVPVASINEQTAIATILSDMDAEIAALEARRDKTREMKQGMMQELLTGRIRLV